MFSAVDDIGKLCKFHENLAKMQPVSCKQEMQIFRLKMATFPLLIVHFFKIKRVEVIDKMDKLCKFHENPTKNVDFIA